MRYLLFLPLIVFWMAGCGETHDNDPLAGDIDHVVVEANQSVLYATRHAQADATAYYTLDVPERNVTQYVEWTSSNTTIAEVDTVGLVSGMEFGGNVTIKGGYRGFEDTVTLRVIALEDVRIVPPETNLTQEQTVHLRVDGTFADGKHLDVTDAMEWVLGDVGESNASLEQNGTLYTGDFNGTLEVNVSRYDVNDSLKLYVAP